MARKRIAIIGLGMAAAPHAQSPHDLADRVEVAAAYSPTEARRTTFAERWGFPVTGDIDAIFADGTIDAVMVLAAANRFGFTQRAARACTCAPEKPWRSRLNAPALVHAVERSTKLGIAFSTGSGRPVAAGR